MSAAGDPRRLDGIQAARALAALGVVLFHSSFVVRSMPAEWRWEPSFPYIVGFNGVFLFFVISGFIIAKVISGGFELRGFALKRFVRIYPLYWAVTAIAIGLEQFGITFAQQPLEAPYIARSLAILPMAPPMVPAFSLGWTLEHEMVFYALAAAMGLLGGVRALFACVLALGVAGAVLQIGVGQGRWPDLWTWHVVDYHNLYFAAGVGLFLIQRQLRRLGVLLPLLLSGAALWASLSGRYSGPPVQQFVVAVGGMAAWAVLLCAALMNAQDARFPRWLQPAWRALVAVGNWSYSLYLVHYLIMRPAELAVLRWNAGEQIPWAAEPIRWATIGLSLALAAAVYRWVEAPLIDFGHRLARKPRILNPPEPVQAG